MRHFRWLPAGLALVIVALRPATAEPRVTVATSHYDIQGKTAAQLKDQMKRRGPNGFWAYTRWYVRWTGDCRLSLEISYTYPRWTNRNSADAGLRSKWDRMIASLKLHEEGHGGIGLSAAREIEQSGCKGNPKTILDKWLKREKQYDRETRHGETQGVVLN